MRDEVLRAIEAMRERISSEGGDGTWWYLDRIDELSAEVAKMDAPLLGLVPFELKDLNRGDIVQHQRTLESYVVTDLQHASVTLVRTETLTNPAEWRVLRIVEKPK